jgi:ABC-type transport system substrate-binding protein
MSLKKVLPVIILISSLLIPSLLALAQQIEPDDPRIYGPYIDKITYPVMKDYNMRLMAFEANEIDLVGVLPRDLQRIRQNRPDAHIIMTASITSLGALHFNVQLWPVKYWEVRAALAHLWNRDKIIAESPLAGIAVKCTTLVPPTHGAWVNLDADYEKLYPYDPDKAKELLSRVFVPCTGPDGKPAWCDPREGNKVVEIELLTLPQATSPTYYWIAEYIKSEAEKIGLRIKIVPVSSRELDARTSAGTAQAWIIGWSFGRFPDFLYFFFHSSEIRPGGWNEWRVSDPELDQILEKFYFAKSVDEAMQYAHKAQDILVKKWIPWIPTYTGVGITAWNGAIDRDSLVLVYAPPMKDPVGYSWLWWNNVRFKDRKWGGTLRYYFTVDLTSLHPAYYLWATEADAIFRVYAGFMITRSENIYAEPRLRIMLKDYKLEEVPLPNGTKWYRLTLNLFDGMLWQDGVPITAEDVAYTIQKFGMELKARRYYDPSLKNIIEMKVLNKTALQILFKDFGWLDLYTYTEYVPLPKHIFERLPDPTQDPSLVPHPTIQGLTAMVGSGPFVLVKRELAYAELMWNPIYFWRHPDRTVQFKSIEAPTAVDAGKPFTVRVTLVDYLGAPVTNGTVKVSVSGPRTLGPFTARHVGSGVYEVTVPGLDAGTYKLVIEASMPIMIWSLSNVATVEVSVGAVTATPPPTTAAPTIAVPTLSPIEVKPAIGELKPVTIPMPAPVTVAFTPVEITKPTIEIKTVATPTVTDMSSAVIALAVITLIASAITVLIRRK